MNKIDYMLSMINRRIPKEILTRAFTTPVELAVMPTSMSYTIRQEVIESILLPDMNLVGGIESLLPVSLASVASQGGGLLIRFPMTATGGKEITSILSLTYGYSYSTNGTGDKIADALIGPTTTADVRMSMVDTNTIYVESNTLLGFDTLRCILTHDRSLTNISPRALPLLAELAVLAAKGCIYNKLTIKVAKGEIFSGVELSRFSEIVESYSDSFEMYQELMESRWIKASQMQDRVTTNRMLRMLIPR